jgi:small subunit ribosomal protein S11
MEDVTQTPPAVEEKPEGATTEATAAVAPKRRGGKKRKVVTQGQAHILATYNNTIITLTDQQGNVLAWASAGHVGFRGPKKSTPYAATQIVRSAIEKVKDMGLANVDVFVRGVGSGREAAIRALHANGLNVLSIKDRTPVPHNGPRPRKVRRV